MSAQHSSPENLARRTAAQSTEGYAEARRAYLSARQYANRRLAMGLSQTESPAVPA